VDEAAAIPSQILLSAITEHSNAVKFAVFSTTIHGYEGTGRGFEYKFKPLLKNNFKTVENLSLTQPIRWSNNDFLEADINNMLMTNAAISPLLEQQKISVNSDNVQFKTLSSQQLIAQPDKLNALFGLLVNAHYRTTPNDLRNMLDGPNMHIFCLEYKGNIIGALLLAAEGKISPGLAEQIWQGRRRPKGHLLPQSLLAHSGFKQAGNFSYGRVVRIAINPELQHQGLGSLLLNKVPTNLVSRTRP
jgi:tRNA(Met) cytidine acetyltransferase